MKRIRLDAIARGHMREIESYSRGQWGADQAEAYVRKLPKCFDEIAAGRAYSRHVAVAYRAEGYLCRCAEHFIYWRPLENDAIAIVAVLHQRMHQVDRVRHAFDKSP